jgi:hypothetical protein
MWSHYLLGIISVDRVSYIFTKYSDFAKYKIFQILHGMKCNKTITNTHERTKNLYLYHYTDTFIAFD